MIYRSTIVTKCVWLCGIIFIAGFTKIDKQSCEKYKTGKFYIYNKLNKQRINIERRDSLQIETNELTGDMTISKVKWNGPCDYELFFNYMTPKEVSKDTSAQRIFNANADTPLQIKILSGTDSYYVFEASKQGFQSLRDTVWLVK
jgi:hypothetical protein